MARNPSAATPTAPAYRRACEDSRLEQGNCSTRHPAHAGGAIHRLDRRRRDLPPPRLAEATVRACSTTISCSPGRTLMTGANGEHLAHHRSFCGNGSIASRWSARIPAIGGATAAVHYPHALRLGDHARRLRSVGGCSNRRHGIGRPPHGTGASPRRSLDARRHERAYRNEVMRCRIVPAPYQPQIGYVPAPSSICPRRKSERGYQSRGHVRPHAFDPHEDLKRNSSRAEFAPTNECGTIRPLSDEPQRNVNVAG